MYSKQKYVFTTIHIPRGIFRNARDVKWDDPSKAKVAGCSTDQPTRGMVTPHNFLAKGGLKQQNDIETAKVSPK